jgi:hypothetical protein
MDAIAAAAMARSERERGVLLLLLVATMIGYYDCFCFGCRYLLYSVNFRV